jgi:hypothetical protein
MENNPTQEIENLVNDMQQNMHTCIPGKIERFDAGKCLAVVTPTGQFKTPAGKTLDYPQVNDVPVVLIQSAGQKTTIAYPIKQGDSCLIFFSEQQLDKFRDDEDAKCDLRFDLTNAIAIVGLFAQANDVIKEACDNSAVIIDNEGSRVTVKKDEQECKVGGSIITLKNGEATIKASAIKLDGDLTVTGKVTAQQTIDAAGDITSSGKISGLTVSDSVNSLTEHTHAAPGSPAIPLA